MNNLNKMLAEVILEAKNKNIPISNEIEQEVCIDYMENSRVGFCEWKLDGKYKIHISDRLLKARDKKIKEILAHEVLHTCLLCKNHLFVWTEYATIMNEAYGYHITETVDWKMIEE